jgi:hypothetical protein
LKAIKKIRAYVALILFYFITLSFPGQAFAGSSVIINEIAWMGSKIESIDPKNWWRYEWFELYNNALSPISLEGWKIELYGDGLDWSLNLKGEIPANGYFLAVSSDKIFPSYSQNYSNLKGNFLNEGQKFLLKDHSGNIVDEINCSGGWFAGDNENKLTMERRNTLTDSNASENWQNSKNTNGTPGQKNDDVLTGEQPAPAVTVKKDKGSSAYQEKQLSQSNGYPLYDNFKSILTVAVLCALSSGFAIIFLKKSLNKKSSLDK